MSFFRKLFRRTTAEQELQRELQFHLEQEAAAHERAGLDPAEARRRAHRDFGGLGKIQEDVRAAWGVRWIDHLKQDLAYALRTLRHQPGFAAIVILTLALGIGANTAIFSVVHGVVLRALPYRAPERLFEVRQSDRSTPGPAFGTSPIELADFRERLQTFSGLAEHHSMWFILLGRPEPERIQTGVVSANFFGVLGVKPILGRDFTEADEQMGANAVILLTHEYWQRSFAGDPNVVGRVYEMNDRPHTVVGILPPLPAYPNANHIYVPTCGCPFRSSENSRTQRPARIISQVIGRLKDGVSLEQARADLQRVAAQLAQENPSAYRREAGYTANLVPLDDSFTGDSRAPLYVLLATAGFVLLLACANVANLTLSRLVHRERELTVRAALGAGRGRLFRQLLTETCLLSALGGLAGLAVAAAGLPLLLRYTSTVLPQTGEITLHWPMLCFTLGVSILTVLVFGSRPALPATDHLGDALKDGARGSGGRRTRLRAILVVAQVAISVPLLVGAGLSARSLLKLEQADPGVRTDSVLTAALDLNFARYNTPPKRLEFWLKALTAARELPGVQSVGLTGREPLNGLVNFLQPFLLQDRPPDPRGDRPQASVTLVEESYFETVGQPLLQGRAFRADDTATSQPVLIVNQSLASRYWPQSSALGRQLTFDNGQTWAEIVGVVANARQQLNHDPVDELYVPLRRTGPLTASIVVRTQGDATALSGAVRATIRAVDPHQPITRLQTLSETRAFALLPYRLIATLLGCFAGLALVICLAGLGGVLAYSVSQRTQEIGVRMALGASQRDVLWMILQQGLRLVGAGLLLGTAAALTLGKAMTSVLYGVQASDPLTFTFVLALLILVALAASLLPARRATRINPIVALRAN